MSGCRLMIRTFEAAPPVMTDLMKIPKSLVPASVVDVLPLTLTPSPADPVSLSGISNDNTSRLLVDVKTESSAGTPARSLGCKI